jgi:hypothetical protein
MFENEQMFDKGWLWTYHNDNIDDNNGDNNDADDD